MRIYTRTGDDGETGLIGGERVGKDDAVIDAFGSLDELNSAIGFARAAANGWALDLLLGRVQSIVFEIGSEVASPVGHAQSQQAVLGDIVGELERSIDMQEKLMPKLTQFVLPGGSELGARLHLARCQCRRAERRLVQVSRFRSVRPEILAFLNRLSDWLFVAARTANHEAGLPEPVWTKEN